MSEGGEQTLSPAMPNEQRLAIAAQADLRRRSQDISVRLNELVHSPSITEAPLSIKPIYESEHLEVLHAMQADTRIQTADPSTLNETITIHLNKATTLRGIRPNVAALHFAKAAALLQASGNSYEEALNQAKRCLDISQQEDSDYYSPYNTPADFLPDAIIIGIERRAAEAANLPEPAEVAQAVSGTPGLLTDYALVLPEQKRAEFISAFPEEDQQVLSLELDSAVSHVLDTNEIGAQEDIDQRENVKERVINAFSKALQSLGQPTNIRHIPSSELGSPWSSKQLAQTLSRLSGDDAVRLLKDISEQTTDQLKALNKQLKKKSPDERARAMRPFISFTARVLDTLIEVDTKRGGVLASRFLEMTVLPDRLFTHFARKLVSKDYFSQNLPAFLSRENIPVLKKIIAKYGSQFNTVIDTFSKVPDYTADHNLVPHKAEIMEALAELGTLTPRIFDTYRQLPIVERKVFAKEVKEARQQLFRNRPIKEILPPKFREILTEMVYMAYKPMGMSFEKVAELISKIDDHTDDLERYSFPEEGYPFTFERGGRYVVKDQERVDIASLRQFRDLLTPTRYEGDKKEQSVFAQATQTLFTTTEETQTPGQSRDTFNRTEAIKTFLAPLAKEPHVQEFLQRANQLSTDNAYQVGSELAEIMGVYFRDNYQRLLTDYFTTHEEEFRQVTNALRNPLVRVGVDAYMKNLGSTMNWQEFDRKLETSVRNRLQRLLGKPTTNEAQQYVSAFFYEILKGEYIVPIEKRIQGELAKFVPIATESTYISRGTLRAYISKNVGSFFAKAAAGICTAEDIPLFEREDHFHINIVESDETVRANIQAYITKVNGRPSLVLRGFNPTADWVGKIDIESFCEQVLAIGKQFQEANGLAGVYITEQGGWHALSNREQVAQYLMRRYIDNQPGVSSSLQVASSHTVSKIYPVSNPNR